MMRPWRSRSNGRVLAWLVLAALLAGCSTGSVGDGSDGRAAMPGPVPEGVTFRPAPAHAPAAPSFELSLLDGESIDTAEHAADRPIVLVFFESWCELCSEQQQEINAVTEELGDIVLFLGIAGTSEPADVRAYVTENDIAFPVGTDPTGEIWLQYAVEEPPLVALISQGGALVRGWPGGVGGEDLREQVDQLVVGPAP